MYYFKIKNSKVLFQLEFILCVLVAYVLALANVQNSELNNVLWLEN